MKFGFKSEILLQKLDQTGNVDHCYPQGRAMSLDQCLQHFISSETIQEVECENCTKVQSLHWSYTAKLKYFVQIAETN